MPRERVEADASQASTTPPPMRKSPLWVNATAILPMASSASGKIAFITGGASGIGAALTTKLVEEAEVWIADRQVGPAEELAQGLNSGGARAHAIEVDVRSFPSFERGVAAPHLRDGTPLNPWRSDTSGRRSFRVAGRGISASRAHRRTVGRRGAGTRADGDRSGPATAAKFRPTRAKPPH